MRSLAFRLYLVILLSMVGISWLIDRYYDTTMPSDIPDTAQHLALSYAAILISRTSTLDEANRLLQQHASEALTTSLPQFTVLEPGEWKFPAALHQKLDHGEIITLASQSRLSLYQRVPDQQWVLKLDLDVPNTPPAATRLWLTLLFYSGIAGTIFLWAWPLVRETRQLERAAIAIGKGELDTRVNVHRSDSLRALKQSFNAMAAHLQRLNQDNQLFGQAVSHELRTPLSSLRFSLESLAGADHTKHHVAYQRAEQQLDRMETLISEALSYARLDQAPMSQPQQVPIELVIRERVNTFSALGCKIHFQLSRPTQSTDRTLYINAEHFIKIVDNLIRNACQHAQQQVHVMLDWQTHIVWLHVEDDGAGIPEAERDQVFLPFNRGEKTPSAMPDDQRPLNFGLGLAIVKRLLELQNADIQISTAKLGGAKISVCWQR